MSEFFRKIHEIRGHSIDIVRIIGGRRYLYTCSCGREWLELG